MPSLLNYAIVTDPTSLQASQPGAPSVGTLYVIVSNTHQSEVKWEFIDVEIPVGSGPNDLTGNPTMIGASVEKDYTVWLEEDPVFGWDGTLGRFRAKAPVGGRLTLPDEESLVLKLENIPVSDAAGLVRVKIHERSGGGDDNVPIRQADFTTTLGLVKQAPKVPRNFRPEKNSLVDVDASQNVVLKWEGPDNLDYWIRDPQGTEVLVQSAAQGPQVNQQPYTWSPPPRRGEAPPTPSSPGRPPPRSSTTGTSSPPRSTHSSPSSTAGRAPRGSRGRRAGAVSPSPRPGWRSTTGPAPGEPSRPTGSTWTA